MKRTILFCLCLIISTLSQAQTLTALDADSKQPLELVFITSQNPKAHATTNAEGQADISAFSGADNIEISTLGYQKRMLSFADLRADNFKIELSESNLNLDEVVVAATRWRQTSGNQPAKVVSIAQREVAIQNPQTAADLLGISAKVYIQKSQQGGGSPMIRGFATNRLLYAIDGVRMNTAIFRSGNIQNVISMDPFAIENTEVVFGPGSVIYGSDAIGGVMSFSTLSPQLALEDDRPFIAGKAVARFASANQEKTGHFDVQVGWKKWAMVTSFSTWNFDNLRQGSHGPKDYLKPYYVQRVDSTDQVVSQSDPLLQIPSAYTQTNLMQKVYFQPNDHWNFQYTLHYSETSPYGRYDRHNRVRNDLPRYAEWDYGPQKWQMNHLRIEHQADSKWFDQMRLNLAYQNFEESRIDRSLNRSDRSIQIEQVGAYSANLDFIKSTSERNTLFYGAEYISNDVHSTGNVEDIRSGETQAGPGRYPESSWASSAVYVNDQYRVSETFSLQAGLRYNQFLLNADFDTTFYPFPFTTANINSGALTGSIGAVYRPSDTWVISTNFGTAFRSPNVDDIGKVFDSEPGAVTIPNPDLKAEYAYNLDLGIAKVFGEHIKVDATAYYTILQNALVRRNFQLNGQDSIFYQGELSQVQALQNAAQATVYGVQAGLEIKFPGGFSLSSDLNYQHGEEELDDGTTSPSRHAAPLFGTTRLVYHAKKLHLQLYSVYQGERSFDDLAIEERNKDEIYAKDANGNNYAPAWYTLNFKALYQFADHFTVSAGLENLTDQRYRPYSSGISAPGRNFILSFNVKF
ncbi:MAG: TonB-dependent receptor [Saprospiraceae bacterium]